MPKFPILFSFRACLILLGRFETNCIRLVLYYLQVTVVSVCQRYTANNSWDKTSCKNGGVFSWLANQIYEGPKFPFLCIGDGSSKNDTNPVFWLANCVNWSKRLTETKIFVFFGFVEQAYIEMFSLNSEITRNASSSSYDI